MEMDQTIALRILLFRLRGNTEFDDNDLALLSPRDFERVLLNPDQCRLHHFEGKVFAIPRLD